MVYRQVKFLHNSFSCHCAIACLHVASAKLSPYCVVGMVTRGVGPSLVQGLPNVNLGFPSKFSLPEWAIDASSSQYKEIVLEKLRICERELPVDGDYGQRPPRLTRAWEFKENFPYLIFGRDPGRCHCFIGHGNVSPEHCAFVWDSSGSCRLLNLEASYPLKTARQGEHPTLLGPNEDIKVELDHIIEIGYVPRLYSFEFETPHLMKELSLLQEQNHLGDC